MRLYHIIQSMLAQKGANTIKIVSVAVGLLVSTIVFSRLDYNYSYDTCFRDRDNLYQVWMSYELNGEPLGPFTSCVGKMGEGVMEALDDEIEGATLLCRFSLPPLYRGDRRFDTRLIGVDSLFFQTMGVDVISGNPLKDLTVPNVVYLSESTASSIFGDENPIDQTLTIDKERAVTVKGIFKDLPLTTTLEKFNAIVSFPTIPAMGYKQIYWSGGDSWPCYFRLPKGSKLTVKEMEDRLNRMFQSHTPDTDTDKSRVHARPISETYLQNDAVRRMNLIMWILGSALLLMTTLNYVLITIASLSRRAKSIGVHKCSGAGAMTVMCMFLWETAIILLCSVVLMTALLYIFQPIITDTLSISVSDIFASSRLWIPAAVLVFFFIVGGLIPGRIFSRIPVTQVFRRFTERNSAWKRSLLFVQIGGVSFIGCLLVIVSIQYHEILNRDMGFSVDRVAVFDIPYKLDNDALKSSVAALPYVEKIAAAANNPLEGYSGQNILDDAGNVRFNARFGWTDKGFADLLGIRILEGREPEKPLELLINQEFSRRMGWGDHPVGKVLTGKTFTEPATIVGLMEDYAIGGFTEGIRPLMIVQMGGFYSHAYVKLKEPFDRNYRLLTDFLKETYPDYDFSPYRMDNQARELYSDVRMFRNSALIATVTLIFISLMGLIGFARDEVQRRSKEIAIRKVNGAESADIISLLLADVGRISLPAITLGCLCAAYIGHIWLANFTVTASYIWLWYILTGTVVLLLVSGCVLAITLRVANETPVKRLKSE